MSRYIKFFDAATTMCFLLRDKKYWWNTKKYRVRLKKTSKIKKSDSSPVFDDTGSKWFKTKKNLIVIKKTKNYYGKLHNKRVGQVFV